MPGKICIRSIVCSCHWLDSRRSHIYDSSTLRAGLVENNIYLQLHLEVVLRHLSQGDETHEQQSLL
jgi:hypothetical protein